MTIGQRITTTAAGAGRDTRGCGALARSSKKPDQKQLPVLLTRIEAAENWRDRNYRDKWTAYYKMWRNHVDQLKDKDGKPIKDRSNISIPYAFVMLETVLPRLIVTLFA